jgi:hypothetical protein
MTRKAKNPNRIHVSDRNLPGSIVCQANPANKTNTVSATTIRPLPAGLRSTTFTSPAILYNNNRKTKWCTGEDSNLRNAMRGRFTVCCH